MHDFSTRLTCKGYSVDNICTDNLVAEQYTSIRWTLLFRASLVFYRRTQNVVLKRYIHGFIYRYILSAIFKDYDIVDFHAYYPDYNILMRKCINEAVKYDVTLWGSDLMRANEKRLEILRFGFNNAYRIKLSQSLYDCLEQKYGYIYREKCSIVSFGISEIDNIDNLEESEFNEYRDLLLGIIGNKLVICCGYNRMEAQNHLSMIDAIDQLRSEFKSNIHVVLPMTYGGTQEYLAEVKERLKNVDFTYTVLEKFLQDKEVATIRRLSDLMVNIQNTDAASGSVKGHLYCGSVCIIGEWLPYNNMEDLGIYYLKTSKNNLCVRIENAIANFTDLKQKCSQNKDIIRRNFSWEATIQDQVKAYGE